MSAAPILVVGVGSELRRDDAVGRRVADAVAGLGLPDVEVRSIHQLVPELAEAMVGRRKVVIVDATVEDVEVAVSRVSSRPQGGPMTHHLDPAALVAITELLGTAPPDVVVVSVPASDLGIGTGLSPASADAVQVAVSRVVAACGGLPSTQ